MKDIGGLIPISQMSISEISDDELETAFLAVAIQHKDAIASIHQSMVEAQDAYEKYLDKTYEPLEEQAKKDRAQLNKAEKNIAEKYAQLKTAYEKPLETVEMNIKSIRSAIKKASGIVDDAVKIYEGKQKEVKWDCIREYFDSKNFGLVPLIKIFDDRWLNKTYKMADITKEIDTAINTIYDNIKILENITEYGVIAKSSYLETLDMGAAMRQVDTLKANAERLAREKIEREERQRQAQIAANAEELLTEERNENLTRAKTERVQDIVNEALGIEEPEAVEPEILEYTLKLRGTKEQSFKLREYMTLNQIAYERVG